MLDLSLLEGAGILLAGMVAGRFWPARRRGPKPKAPVQPVCGCKHNYSYHDPKTAECHGRVEVGYWNAQYHYEGCTCRVYAGPTPMPEYYAPEIT